MSFLIETELRWAFVTNCSLFRVIVVTAVAVICGCSNLAEQSDRFADSHKMTRTLTKGAPFLHVLYTQKMSETTRSLHVYIEGDGRPWDLGGLLPADDPTPRKPLALHMMAKDNSAALYLGRPCYFGLAKQAPCSRQYWTSARYAQLVVDSMATVLNNFTTERSISKVTLIGYSGGGALAVLIASRLDAEVDVVTIAANLDTDAWARAHGYQLLTGSLNPMQAAQLGGIHHHHFGGDQDRNVNADIIKSFSTKHNGHYTIQHDFNHVCCWEDEWPLLLRSNNNPLKED